MHGPRRLAAEVTAELASLEQLAGAGGRAPSGADTCSLRARGSIVHDFSSGVERIATSRVSLVDARRRPRLSYTGRQPVEGDVR